MINLNNNQNNFFNHTIGMFHDKRIFCSRFIIICISIIYKMYINTIKINKRWSIINKMYF
ncbi:conserved hypothetical protein [Ureaplasma urealyticum serovar 10 str. ATCC 33699]|uniref:Uncharacterized protein n=2 Tax=Ureaplasma urealyticum TaxID=2130 RepID=A0AAX1QZB4_UREUR|nr:conserved hypothetical protein [Ureaplasma urealyticum serovar 10 str. ATCC 33699]EDT49632.1 hypothetical protein UUR13_0550 [Ureaplasma urealyticum serovar 13 str. ATCC 33698]RCJ00611.1 hypothetical protein DSQ42_03305 [Ureaplasma urealyticum]RCT49679.1 hypothetical protein DTQ60_03030 [Ureaplasma urealyticum]